MIKKYIILLMIVCFAAAYGLSGTAAEQVSTADELELLLTSADSLIDEHEITVHYSSLFSPDKLYDNLHALGNHLLLQLPFPMTDSLQTSHTSQQYTTTVSDDHIHYSLRIHHIEEQDIYHLSVQLVTDSINQSEQLLKQQLHQLEDALAKLGLDSSASILIQGSPMQQYTIDLEAWQRHMTQALQLQHVEGYQDHSSTISSYYTPLLNHGIQTGQQEMNLQTKLHQDTESQQWRVSIGYPIIIGE